MAATRRDLLIGGAAAAAAWPMRAMAVPGPDSQVRSALDSLATLPTPAAKIARLSGLSTDGVSHSALLDLVTVRQGLAVDERIAQLFPNAIGRSPYPVGPTWGAWLKAVEPAMIDADTAAIGEAAAQAIVLPQPFLDRTIVALQAKAAGAAPPLADALKRQAAVLVGLRAKAAGQPGVWQLAHGEYYALLLERALGEAIDPAAAHDRLMGEWKRLAEQADRLLGKLGFHTGSIGDRFRAMFQDARWHYPDTSEGRDKAVADMNATLDRARARVPALIGPAPSFCLQVRARRMSPVEEAAGKGGYRVLAGPTVPGAYFVDLADIRRRPSWSLASVVHHELLPGHMIQLPIEAAADPHPLRLEYAPAFAEGWGVYAEMLSAEAGAFAGDDAKLLGYLHWALFRIGRGIVDTGIHHARWSRQEALNRLSEIQGEPAYFAPFESDVDRICLDPAIRAAEALTALRLGDLRRQVTRAGGQAGMRRFHRIVLADGRKRLATIEADLTQ